MYDAKPFASLLPVSFVDCPRLRQGGLPKSACRRGDAGKVPHRQFGKIGNGTLKTHACAVVNHSYFSWKLPLESSVGTEIVGGLGLSLEGSISRIRNASTG